jgi:excisionase family DNA binding protein
MLLYLEEDLERRSLGLLRICPEISASGLPFFGEGGSSAFVKGDERMLTGPMSDHTKDHQTQDPAHSHQVPHADSLLVSVEEAAAILGIGRTNMVRLISQGAIKSVKIGRRRLVVRSELEGFIETLLQGELTPAADLAGERDRCDYHRRTFKQSEERGATS